MTSIKGIVIDRTNNDVVVVGLRDKSRPELTLDDLVVALRMASKRRVAARLALIRPPKQESNKLQKVRYEGRH